MNYLPLSEGKHKKSEEQDEQLVLFDKSRFREDIIAVIKGFHTIEEMPSEKLSDIKAKKKTFDELMEELDRYREIANLWTSLFFGNTLEEKEKIYEDLLKDQFKYQTDMFGSDAEVTVKKKLKTGISNQIYSFVVSSLQSPDKKAQISALGSLLEKSESIARDKNFFHWELEFPEVFFNADGSPNENPGFDCVIGNPPYDVLSELEQGRDVNPEKEFFSQNDIYRPAIGSKLNFYRLFSAVSLDLLKSNGMHGFIVPMALLADKQAKPLREFILKKNCLQKIEALPQKDDPTNRVFPEAKLSTCIYILCKQKPSLFNIRIHPGRDILESSTHLTIKPSQIEEFDKENLSIPSYPTMTIKDFNLALKLNRVSDGIILKHFASSQQGEVNLTSHSEYLTDEEKGQIILRGAHINRYEFQEEPKQGTPMYLNVKRFLGGHGKDTKAYDHKYIRIGYQRGSAIDNWRRIIATIVEKDNFCSDTINYIVNPKEYDLFAILALLNSSLWEWRFRLTSTNNHVNSYEIDSMPMPPISFITHEKERKEFFKEAVKLYERSKYDDVVKWAEYELALHRNDTVHDFLAYLAEQMIELNKAKGEEIKGFLKWLEREIGAEIDALANKTAIKEYHDNYFNHLLDVLKKNKNRLSIDPSDRKKQELLEKYFVKSLSILEPLKDKIKATDKLIDQIVYKLYGLTDEEIEIVEGKG